MDRAEAAAEGDVSSESSVDEELLHSLRRRNPLRRVLLTASVVVVAAFTIVAWNRFGTDPSLVDSPLIGNPAPTFALPALDAEAEGEMVRSTDYDGRLYVVNFWASWCVPCRQEAPELESFYQRWSQRGVGMVGIVYNDRAEDARDFREEFGLSYPQALDPDGVAAIDFGVFGVPETFVVDERGVVMAKLIGAVGPGTLDEVVTQVLSGDTYTSQNDDYRTQPG